MWDNNERVYTKCNCGQINVMHKGWHGPCPTGAVLCSKCNAQLPFITFRHAYTGARWADRFYARLRG
jgi:hypothetical protein